MRRLRLVSAPAVGPHRHTALGSRALERPPRGRVDPRLDAPYVREPYFFSDIGRLRVQQVRVADTAVDWQEDDGLVVGRDPTGVAACVLLLNAPARLRAARALVATAGVSPTSDLPTPSPEEAPPCSYA